MKIKTFLTGILLCLLCGCASTHEFLYGDASYKWQVEAYDIYQNGEGNCQIRVNELSRQMTKEGIDHDICWGLYKKLPHMWVELNGKIIDPSQFDDNKRWYEKQNSVHVTKEIRTDVK